MFFRTLLLWAAGLPITVILFVVVLLSLLIDRSGRCVHSIAAFWCKIILLLSGVKVRVRGGENVPRDRPVTILSNHQGAYDIPVLLARIPIQYRWVAKKSLFSIPVIGWTMTLAGYIDIERDKAGRAYKSIEAAKEKVFSGTSILIFPEGTRSEDGTLLPFKKGAFRLVAGSGVDILPVAVQGTGGIMKRGRYSITPAEVILSFAPPIPTGDASVVELRNRTKAAIAEMLET